MLPVNETAHDLDSVSIAVYNLDPSLFSVISLFTGDLTFGIVQKHLNSDLSSLTSDMF